VTKEELYDKATFLREQEHFVKAFPLFVEAASAGLVKADYWVAYLESLSYEGLTSNLDDACARRERIYPELMRLAEEGDSEALSMIACYYYGGFPPVITDIAQAKAYFQKSADLNYPLGCNLLGNLLRDKENNGPDALKAFIKAGDLGFSSGYNNAANLFYWGAGGLEVDHRQSLLYFEKAAELGNRYSQNNLGSMYLYGDACDKDPEKALRLFRLSAKQHHPRAYANLGKCYRYGYGVVPDQAKALAWFLKAVNDPYSHVFSFFDVIDILQSENKIKQANYYRSQIVGAFETAAKNFPDNCSYLIGLFVCYRDGIGVEKDERKAAEFLQKGPALGNAQCQYLLSQFYGDKKTAVYDPQTSRFYLQKAAEKGYLDAQFRYGSLLEEGFPSDPKGAFVWFSKAAESLHPESLAKVGVYHLFGLGGAKKDASLARSYLEKANAHGCNSALFYLYTIAGPSGELNTSNAMAHYAADFAWDSLSQNERYQKVVADLTAYLTPCWPLLSQDSRIALSSGLLTYINYKELEKNGVALDYSQVSNPFNKALEIELAHYFYSGYLRYLSSHRIALDKFNERGAFFVLGNDPKQRGLADPEDVSRFTLGRFSQLTGEKISPYLERGVDWDYEESSFGPDTYLLSGYNDQQRFVSYDSEFLDFCQASFQSKPSQMRSREGLAKLLFSLSEFIKEATKTYRNVGAHKGILLSAQAEGCGNLLIMVEKLLLVVVSCFYSDSTRA
jgi:TPR repeat protein